MKNIGIKFETPSDDTDYNILDFLSLIDIEEYNWEIDNDEVYIFEEGELTNNSLFKIEERILEGNVLKSKLSNNIYYPIFLIIKAYPKTVNRESFQTIENVGDYIKSDCIFLIDIVDYGYLSIYSKDETLLPKLRDHIKKLGYVNVKYILSNSKATFC